jgi:uncharacterized protein
MTQTLEHTDIDPVAARDEWHAQRNADLAVEHGWLTLTGLYWLPARPGSLPGVPGQWWADRDGVAHVRGDAADRLRQGDAELVGEASVRVEEGRSSSELSFVEADGTVVVVEVIRRTGRTAVRVRDPRAAARAAFSGVPIADYDPSWVVEATLTWYDAPRAVVVGAAQLGLVHHVELVGEATFERDGETATVALSGYGDGKVGLLFSDESADVAPWRILQASAQPGDETLRLDFNRAVNLPYAFSDFGTCPAPVEGNHLRFAVTAGERRPERAG